MIKEIRNRKICLTLFAGIVLTNFYCASQKHYKATPIITEAHDNKNISKPKEQVISVYEDAIENMIGREINEFGNLSWHIRKLTNNHKQAKNTNALDEVANSSWFINRHASHPMSISELKQGSNKGNGPDTTGFFTVIGAKAQGVSPGFTIKDQRGDVYFVKFDMKGFPQLNTAAEVITTKFVYACGYNVPENYLSVLNLNKLKIAEGTTVLNRWAKEVPMTMEFVREVLKKVNVNPDGTYRLVASKRLEGKPIGPFYYVGRRKDDPNDHIPHNNRRELRGYKIIAAWLNNNDAKANNTLDMYVTENDKSFIRHYIIDFATSLGSSGYGQANSNRGHVGAFDLSNMLMKICTLGLWVEPWEKEMGKSISPSVGYFESELFDPGNYAQIVQNPAFQKITELDGFWAAKIIMSFTDEQIRAIVTTGEYEKKADEDYIAQTLIERRDKVGRYWYGKVNPLDKFQLNLDEPAISFVDLATKAGFEKQEDTTYRYKLQYRGDDLTEYLYSEGISTLPINSDITAKAVKVFKASSGIKEKDKILTFHLETKRAGKGSWGKHVKVHFYYPSDNIDSAQIVAIEREN